MLCRCCRLLIEPECKNQELSLKGLTNFLPGSWICLWTFFQKRLQACSLNTEDQIEGPWFREHFPEIDSQFRVGR